MRSAQHTFTDIASMSSFKCFTPFAVLAALTFFLGRSFHALLSESDDLLHATGTGLDHVRLGLVIWSSPWLVTGHLTFIKHRDTGWRLGDKMSIHF